MSKASSSARGRRGAWAAAAAALWAAGCDPRGPADPEIDALLGFTPSNVPLSPEMFEGVGDVVMDSPSGCTIGAVATGRLNCGADRAAYRVHELLDKSGQEVVLVTLRSLLITEGTEVAVEEDRPLVIVALDSLTISGSVTVTPGETGGAPSAGSDAEGEGEGAGRASARSPQNGSGGAHCGRGGAAGDGTASPEPYGNIFLAPLRGGSSGGGRFGGAGGGALQLVAGRALRVDGVLSAPGQGRANVDGGGGSGGGLLLESQAIELRGVLAANGGGGASEDKVDGEDGLPSDVPAMGGRSARERAAGGAGSGGATVEGEAGGAPTRDTLGGGSGGGGAGRIRINVLDEQLDAEGAVLSPSLDTLCAIVGDVLVGAPAPAEGG